MTNADNVSNTKPSTVETLKEKAVNLVHKVTGKSHSNTTEEHKVDDLNVREHSNPLHTGAAASDAAVPHNNTVDRAAYQQQIGVTGHHADPLHKDHHHSTLGSAAEAGTAGAALTGAAVHHEHNKEHRHEDAALQGDHHHSTLGTAAEAGTAGAALTGAAVHHEHNKERRHEEAALQGDRHHNLGAAGGFNAGTIQHPAVPAGPTGTSNIPSFTQNIAPMASGVVPTAVTTEPFVDSYVAPVNTNNSTVPVNTHNLHQTAPVHSNNNTIPALGATGTTTAAGTHVPGEYNATNTQRIPGDYNNNAVPALGATGTTTAAGTHVPGEYNATNTQRIPGDYNNNTVPALGATGTTTAAGTHAPGEYNATTQHIPGDYNNSTAVDNNRHLI